MRQPGKLRFVDGIGVTEGENLQTTTTVVGCWSTTRRRECAAQQQRGDYSEAGTLPTPRRTLRSNPLTAQRLPESWPLRS